MAVDTILDTSLNLKKPLNLERESKLYMKVVAIQDMLHSYVRSYIAYVEEDNLITLKIPYNYDTYFYLIS